MPKSSFKTELASEFKNPFDVSKVSVRDGSLVVVQNDTVHKINGIYDDAMSGLYEFSNPGPYGVIQTGADFTRRATLYIGKMMSTGAGGTFVLGVDRPKHVPVAKQVTQRARDSSAAIKTPDQPFVFKRGDKVVKWGAPMPTSAQIFSNRALKYACIEQAFSRFAHMTCQPVPGQTLFVSGTPYGCIKYAPHSKPEQMHSLPKVGEAELRWVSMLLSTDFPGGTWLIHSKDTDNLCIAMLHSCALLKRTEVFVDCNTSTISLRALVRDIREYFLCCSSDWDAVHLTCAMQLAGNDFQLGIRNCGHKSFWTAAMHHSRFIGTLVRGNPGDVNSTLTYDRDAFQRMLMCALYVRYKLAATLPPPYRCTWKSVQRAVLAKVGTSRSGVVPDTSALDHMHARANWNLAYWWRGPWGTQHVPDPLRSGWRKRSHGLIEAL